MKILAASVNKQELLEAKKYGAYGIITNPTVIAVEKKPWKEVVAESAEILDGPFHLQVTETEPDKIRRQIDDFYSVIGDRLVIKACITECNLSLIDEWHKNNFKVNITGIVSIPQAFVAIQAKADFLSVYLGRADKIGADGVNVIENASKLISLKNYACEVIAASVKDPMHYVHAALAGADWIACPIPLMSLLIDHPITTTSIEGFEKDWITVLNSK